MNSTYFFTDFATQPDEYKQLQFLKSKGLLRTCGFIGLYGNASILAAADLDAQSASIWETLAQCREIYVCPSAAARRGIDTTQASAPRPGLRWLSLAAMLEHIAPNDGEPREISVSLNSDSYLARIEALELCLAAIALDFSVQLNLRGPGILGLQQSLGNAGAKGYASLAMFGIPHAFIAPADIALLAPFRLLEDALTLPWQLGEALQMPLMFEF